MNALSPDNVTHILLDGLVNVDATSDTYLINTSTKTTSDSAGSTTIQEISTQVKGDDDEGTCRVAGGPRTLLWQLCIVLLYIRTRRIAPAS